MKAYIWITAINLGLTSFCFGLYLWGSIGNPPPPTPPHLDLPFEEEEIDITLYGFVQSQDNFIMKFQPDKNDSWIPMVQRKADELGEAIVVCQNGMFVAVVNPKKRNNQEHKDLQ